MAGPVGFRSPAWFGLAGPVGCTGPWRFGASCRILRSCEMGTMQSPLWLKGPWVWCPAAAGSGRRLVQGACVESCSAAVAPHLGWGQE